MNEFPLAIRFVSDENQAYFVEEGVVYPLELDHINRLISYELIEVIQ